MRISFYPSVYEHAAYLVGRSPWQVSRDPELLFSAHCRAHLLYGHSPIVVGIDIYNIEAEAYGCVVDRPSGNGVPAITRPLFASLEEAATLVPFEPQTAGRIPMIIETGRRLASRFPKTEVAVPVSGPFSVAVGLRGVTGFLEDIALFPEGASSFLMRLVEGQTRLAKSITEAGLSIMFFESAAAPPLLSPEQFRQIELPALKQTISRISATAGHRVPCIIGGDTLPILDDILATGTDYVICPAETDQVAFMRRIWDRTDVKVRINLDPNTVAYGSPEQIVSEVERILKLVEQRPNVSLGTGVVPYETPPHNILLAKSICSAEQLCCRRSRNFAFS
ncbi:MAG: hypothetical protein DRQ24_03405 [Candidatus Latescibacterota bacterium]|nr:MAG: hypothetical protein DRQ24_03405 [Candidatus Latescibacterota bacterium]